MSRLNLAEGCHIVNICPPKDMNGAAYDSDVWSMKNFAHATIIVQLGVTGAASTLKVQACDDFVPTNTTDLAFNIYKEETDSGDTLGARTAVASTGYSTSTNNSIFYVIEVDAEELSASTYSCMRITLSDPAAATLVSAVAILSGQRFAGDQNATAIA